MKKLPLEGSSTILSFFSDDTIETVRQYVALEKGSHPDRLFIQIQVELPKNYYSSNPKRWMDLFFRMSFGKNIIKKEILDAYVTYVRLGTGVSARDVTREEWESKDEFLIPLFDPEYDFKEWRILGVPEDKSVILPIPVQEINLPEAFRPVPIRQSLFDSIHKEECVSIRAEDLNTESPDIIRQVYFPFFQSSTPANIESLRIPLNTARNQLESLLNLKAPKPTGTAILRAKWYIPLISTQFTAPRIRFEQMFYGLTVSPEIPVVSFFTSKSETTRHKFYVEDSKWKKPLLDIPMWRAWTTNTQPQRRIPTLLLYRGKTRISFDRIAITNKDITISTYRSKDSKESLEELQESTLEWLKSFDAIMPFLIETDLDLSRWVLNDMTAIISYNKEISEFDMRRFGCLQNVFGFQDNSFRLLRADHPSDVPAEVIRAYEILQRGEKLETELGISPTEAATLVEKVKALEEDEKFNFEKATSGYPTISFSSKDVMIKFVTNLDRVLNYASMLRYVLTSDKAEVNDVCPRRLETVEATVGIASQNVQIEDEFDLSAFAEDIEEAAGQPEESSNAAAPVMPSKIMKIMKGGPQGTLGYFNNRILKIDPNLIDDEYTKKCEKLTQVVVLTPGDQARIPPEYNYSTAPENEKMEVEKGIAICPQYWCMKDEIPLSEDQLITDDEGKHCPMCGGKVRITDKEDAREFTIIKRKLEYKYPDYKDPSEKSTSKKKVPCCYRKPAAKSAVLSQDETPSAAITDDYYVLSSGKIPALRIGYIPETLSNRFSLKTNYLKTCPKNRIEGGALDTFRIGMGLPRETLPKLFGSTNKTSGTLITVNIPSPGENDYSKESIKRCSFFRTWKDISEGDESIVYRIIDGIDKAYKNKTLSLLNEIEYVSLMLDCRVMQINTENYTMSCGFWPDRTSPTDKTIVLLDTDILGKVYRRDMKFGSKFVYNVDVYGNFPVDENALRLKPEKTKEILEKLKFEKETKKILQDNFAFACSIQAPTFKDAENELSRKNIAQYDVILDPFDRIQALFVPQQVVLPIQPESRFETPKGVRRKISGYNEILNEELPSSKTLAQFLDETNHVGFKKVKALYGADGFYSEFLLSSGFRALFRPEEADDEDDVTEVLNTIRDPHSEEELVNAAPNKEDLKLASQISYSSEVFEFLMFSLSKDIQTEEYETLRNAIKNPGPDLMKQLKLWLDTQAYWDSVNEPVQFVNKVRTPCGQMEKDSCKKSTLCGWHQNTCKIKVKPIVDERQILVRLTKTLKENTKQRALVLDERLSPFFSTILYLEMPHELITTNP
jgi:hypothetical protein